MLVKPRMRWSLKFWSIRVTQIVDIRLQQLNNQVKKNKLDNSLIQKQT